MNETRAIEHKYVCVCVCVCVCVVKTSCWEDKSYINGDNVTNEKSPALLCSTAERGGAAVAAVAVAVGCCFRMVGGGKVGEGNSLSKNSLKNDLRGFFFFFQLTLENTYF